VGRLFGGILDAVADVVCDGVCDGVFDGVFDEGISDYYGPTALTARNNPATLAGALAGGPTAAGDPYFT
jgi:hypothetical protein